MNDDFRIAGGSICMTLFFERRSQVAMVINLAVVGEPDPSVFVCHRLMTACPGDYRETAMAEAHWSINECSCIVRSSMGERVAHARQRRLVNRAIELFRDDNAADSTH